MNVSLTPQLEAWIHGKVETGLYQTASEVVREALRLLREHHEARQLHTAELRRQVLTGLEDLERGRSADLDGDLLAAVKQQGRQRIEGAGR